MYYKLMYSLNGLLMFIEEAHLLEIRTLKK